MRAKAALRSVMRWVLLKLFWAPFYHISCCLRRVDPQLVLFASELEAAPSDNFVPLMGILEKEGYTCRFFTITQALPRWKRHARSLAFLWNYAAARAVFLADNFSPSNACKRRRGTALVQLWHGCGAFKKFGYSTQSLEWGPSRRSLRFLPIHRHYSHVTASSPDIIPQLAEAYACKPSIIMPWGVPRTDAYFASGMAQESRSKVLEAFPEIGERKIILYAPTFRGEHLGVARHDGVLDYDALAQPLQQDCVLLLKPHPQARKHIPSPAPQEKPFVYDAAALPIETLLCAADLLICDYSSLIFEYSLLGRPMLFYPYDLEDYDRERSFYYPYYRFVPGDLVWETEDIISGVQRNLLEGQFDAARVKMFRETYMSACDGHSAQRILHNVLGI